VLTIDDDSLGSLDVEHGRKVLETKKERSAKLSTNIATKDKEREKKTNRVEHPMGNVLSLVCLYEMRAEVL
jgi:hypothetical protein